MADRLEMQAGREPIRLGPNRRQTWSADRLGQQTEPGNRQALERPLKQKADPGNKPTDPAADISCSRQILQQTDFAAEILKQQIGQAAGRPR